ncbi:Delta14-sterol reductase [Hondaea fermentalgiana]|uniref:Delta(14)-sterol reductase n=1 Tax=Hondaea fermentalgiana TaxID=2315210 RepID=A0A2R5GQ17_9STRA|nr:Delta14-sterol reductase [Hondaea fermentalgiana]|eukprot:GBG32972.1 Delta14-sterol reductase [Hondaea fermentalgiana]
MAPTRRARTRSSASLKADEVAKSPAHGSGTQDAVSKEDHFEFGGPIGALGIMFLLPCVILFLFIAASKDYKFVLTNYKGLLDQLPKKVDQVWEGEAFIVILIWFSFHVLLERVLYCNVVEGTVLRDGTRLKYRLSGHLAFWVTYLVLAHGNLGVIENDPSKVNLHPFPLEYIYDHYLQLAMGAVTFSMGLSVYLFSKSFRKGAMLAEGGDTSSHLYNFFIGRELNPRIGSFDLKEFCELRPGLIGWATINAGCAFKQYQLNGHISTAMLLINIFQGIYVWDSLYHERAILSTMDITTDGFGFMLAFGDLAWVPFTYSLQARFLVENDPGLSPLQLALITLLFAASYYAFRSSNSEKDAFRRDPNGSDVQHLKTMPTARGRKLLISGWWGFARKINYTADLCMGLSWCLLTGFHTPVTYFYFIYFFILLVHRAFRDDHSCSQKYGADWEKYKSHVPYLFIPGVI